MVYMVLDVNSTCKPTSTWEAKHKLPPQRDATVTTVQTGHFSYRCSQQRKCLVRLFDWDCLNVHLFLFFLCLFPFLGRADLSLACLFQSSFLCSSLSTFVVGSCPSLGPTSFLCWCPFHSTVAVLVKGVQLLGVEHFVFSMLIPLPLPFWLDSLLSKTRTLSSAAISHNSDGFIIDMSFNSFVFFSPACLSAFFRASCHSLEHGFH